MCIRDRICIARALAAEPDLIICDEVTSALDQLVAEGILELLQNLQNQLGVSYLFITHDLATVKAIADSIVVMYQGRWWSRARKQRFFLLPTKPILSCCCLLFPKWTRIGWIPWSNAVNAVNYQPQSRSTRGLASAKNWHLLGHQAGRSCGYLAESPNYLCLVATRREPRYDGCSSQCPDT